MHSTLPAFPCMCASFRRVSRALTQLYDEALRPLGLRVTQFTVLQALSLAGELSQGQLGEVLALDSTTLTRTLGVLARHGWVRKRPGRDRRERRLCLSQAGRRQLQRATPAWEKVQAHLRRRLGRAQWDNLLNLTGTVTRAVTAEGDSL